MCNSMTASAPTNFTALNKQFLGLRWTTTDTALNGNRTKKNKKNLHPTKIFMPSHKTHFHFFCRHTKPPPKKWKSVFSNPNKASIKLAALGTKRTDAINALLAVGQSQKSKIFPPQKTFTKKICRTVIISIIFAPWNEKYTEKILLNLVLNWCTCMDMQQQALRILLIE